MYSSNRNVILTDTIISDESEKQGVFKGIREGKVTITAVTSENIEGRAELTILPPELVSIEVSPENLSVHVGHVQQFTARGTYSDGQRREVTDLVDWSSSDKTVPIISNMTGSKGLGISPPAGSSMIYATDPGTGVRGSTSLSVTTTKLVSILIQPENPTVFLGKSKHFSAVGLFSNGNKKNISSGLAWISSNPSVAKIDETDDATIEVASKSVGRVSIIALDPVSKITGKTSMNIVSPSLVSIAITPEQVSLSAGRGVSFTATGTFNNGQTKEMTEKLIWSSSDLRVAKINGVLW